MGWYGIRQIPQQAGRQVVCHNRRSKALGRLGDSTQTCLGAYHRWEEALIIDLRSGDCIQVLKEYEDNSIASIVCDPPYGLNFMNKSWDQPTEMLGVIAQDYESEGCEQRGAYQYGGSHTRGYFDNDNTKFRQWNEEWLREVFRILKPEGVIKAFSGTRTFHALSSAMENVGFRDILSLIHI